MSSGKAGYLFEIDVQRTRMWLCLVAGVILGSLFINLFMDEIVKNNISTYSFERMLTGNLVLNSSELFVYLLGRRGVQFILVVIILLLFPAGVSRGLLLLTLGGILGAVVSMQVICSGAKGILSFLLVIFPQAICYLGGIFYSLYTWKRKNHFGVLLVLFGSFLLGIVLESFVNGKLLNFFTF